MDISIVDLPVSRAAHIQIRDDKPNWLIENMWAASGVGVIGGSPKSCKSWLGLDMAVSVASGTPCLARFAVHTKGPALVYLAEDALHLVKERIEHLCQAHGIDMATLDLWVITSATLRLDRADDRQLLDTIVRTIKPAMLVLDPFVRLHRLDENHAQDVAGLLDNLRVLQRTHDLAIVVVHHTRKNGRPGHKGMALRGSSDLWAWGDSNIYLNRNKDIIRMDVEHRSAPPVNDVKVVLAELPLHLEVEEGQQNAPKSLSQRIIDVLMDNSDPMTRTALREAVAVNNKRLGDELEVLRVAGRIGHSNVGWALLP